MAKNKAFTLVELMIAIVVFSIGLIAAYSLLRTAADVSLRSRDEIVGGNLLRERLELVKNLRDSNWIAFRQWDSLVRGASVSSDDPSFCPPAASNLQNCRLVPGYYTIENQFSDPRIPVRIHKLPFVPDRSAVLTEQTASRTEMRLCLDPVGRYTHDCSSPNEKTPFYAYVRVTPVIANDAAGTPVTVSGALSVTATFASTDSGYRELSMGTIITDWKR